jgi:site-specific DNA-adenine methylase
MRLQQAFDIPGLVFLTQPVIEASVIAEYSYKARADFNQSRGKIHYRLRETLAWLRVDSATGLIRGTPNAAGDFTVSVEAYDDAGETARQVFTLHVLPVG